jgi:hypothetical protein
MLGKSSNTTSLHKKQLMFGYRRPPNLRDLLVRADVSKKSQAIEKATQKIATNNFLANRDTPSTSGLKQLSILNFVQTQQAAIPAPDIVVTPPNAPSQSKTRTFAKMDCTSTKCRYCPLLNRSGHITCFATKQTYSCMKNVSCKSSNLIYGISCKVCGKQYVGQTKRKLFERFQGHFYNVDLAREKTNLEERHYKAKQDAVGGHFSQDDHHGISDMTLHVLEFVKLPPDSMRANDLRLLVEKHWIHKLRCPAPLGLNISD